MTDGLSIWTIYDHPTDIPDYFVARRSIVSSVIVVTNDMLHSTDLDELRAELLARGLTKLARFPEDDPKIVETWL